MIKKNQQKKTSGTSPPWELLPNRKDKKRKEVQHEENKNIKINYG